MKKISLLIPCYNEEENVEAMYQALSDVMTKKCARYDYEILFIDNCSLDKTQDILRDICQRDKKVKAIFNAKNFGQSNSPYYGMLQTTGDCVISLVCDFQDPVELIPDFVREWENGYRIVIGIKEHSEENRFVYLLRSCYYKFIKKFSNVEQIEHFTGFGLYDHDFIEVLRKLDDPAPYLRGIVSELGYKRKEIVYTQKKRRAGKSKNNWYTLYDFAMLSITSYTKIGLRACTLLGFLIGTISAVVGIVYLIYKLKYWETFIAGMAPVTIGMFFLGGIQLIFIGMLGEYVITMNQRIMKRPLVIEEERINFYEMEEKDIVK